jgi:hypothetical protein
MPSPANFNSRCNRCTAQTSILLLLSARCSSQAWSCLFGGRVSDPRHDNNGPTPRARKNKLRILSVGAGSWERATPHFHNTGDVFQALNLCKIDHFCFLG